MKNVKGLIGVSLAAFAMTTVMSASSVSAECTGKEKIRTRCKILNKGNNKLIVKISKSQRNSEVIVFLDDEELGVASTNSKGKGKLIETGIEDGPHTVRACAAVKTVNCGR